MLKADIKIDQCQRYKYPHGAVYIGPSDETVSCGFLELSPDRATNKITRPLPEHVKQISGTSEIEMFDENNRITIKSLQAGDTFMIPTNVLHVHRNRGRETSINYWEYQGNAAALVEQMRSKGMLDQEFKATPQKAQTAELTVSIKPEDCQIYQLPLGKIYIAKSDPQQSIGFLQLQPGMALDKHNRPVTEKLKQIKGVTQIELFTDNNQIKIAKS